MKFQVNARAETGSTNDDAAPLLGTPGGAGTVLLADFQRAGRGRHARAWVAPPGSSLLFTALLPESIASDTLWAVTFWAALGVADGIEAATGVRVDLQWPNDLLLGGRKCCGILCVSRVTGDRAWLGCGVGLNVARPLDDGSIAAVTPPPAFLSDENPSVDRRRVLDAILTSFEGRLPELRQPQEIARAWEARAALAGTAYRLLVDGEAEPLEAAARRIGDDGGLVVETNGVERSIALADARVLRTPNV